MPELKDITFSEHEARVIFGSRDENLRFIEQTLGVGIFGRGNSLKVRGTVPDVEKTVHLLERLKKIAVGRQAFDSADIMAALAVEERHDHPAEEAPDRSDDGAVRVHSRKSVIYPQTPHQRAYLEAIREHDLTIGIGPAGTGKTYLAVASAIEALKQGYYQRIILTRPALEAGERLGFLPGDLEEKIKPYLQPIYDALFDIMKYEELRRWTERKIIEVVPLAYMRGRTLSEAFIILDEAQNTSSKQIQMFLTRLGRKSKAVITGDITQIDHPLTNETSGLVDIQTVLKGIRGVKFVYFSPLDVVRHPLVKKIINAYAKHRRTKTSGVRRGESAEGRGG